MNELNFRMNIKCINQFLGIVIAILFTSCGGQKNSNIHKSEFFNLSTEKNLNGPFSESFEVINAKLKIGEEPFESKLLVEVKRTSAKLPIDTSKVQVCGIGLGKDNEWCFIASILDENKVPIDTTLGRYSYEPFKNALSLKNNETIWLNFNIPPELMEHPSKAQKVEVTSIIQKTNSFDRDSSDTIVGGKKWDKLLNEYEEYSEAYIRFYKKALQGDRAARSRYPVMKGKANTIKMDLEKALVDNRLSIDQIKKMSRIKSKTIAAESAL